MPKFRSKPTQIEAAQWFKDGDHPGVFVGKSLHHPGGACDRRFVQTVGGEAEVFSGDWIVNEAVPDKFYPCRPDVFEKRYEPA